MSKLCLLCQPAGDGASFELTVDGQDCPGAESPVLTGRQQVDETLGQRIRPLLDPEDGASSQHLLTIPP